MRFRPFLIAIMVLAGGADAAGAAFAFDAGFATDVVLATDANAPLPSDAPGTPNAPPPLSPEVASRIIARLVYRKSGADYRAPILQMTPPVAGVVAALVVPPYREFPNVVFFRFDSVDGTWRRQLEGLALGLQDDPSGLLDLHTTGEAVDVGMAGEGSEDPYKATIEAEEERGYVAVAYDGFYHLHPAGPESYTIDKRAFRKLAARLVSDRYEKDYPQNECTMYETPPLKSIALSKRDSLWVLVAETDPGGVPATPQRWTVTFAGFDHDGMLLDKKIDATVLCP